MPPRLRPLPRGARVRLERDLPRPGHEPLPAARRQLHARGCRGGLFLRLARRPRRRPGLHPRRDVVVTPRQRRGREEPHHPPRQHDPPSVERGRAQGCRGRSGDDSPVGRGSRRPPTSSGTSNKASRVWSRRTRPRCSTMTPFNPDRLSGSAHNPARDSRRQDGRHRRAVEQSPARQLLRRLLSQASRLSHHPGQPA